MVKVNLNHVKSRFPRKGDVCRIVANEESIEVLCKKNLQTKVRSVR